MNTMNYDFGFYTLLLMFFISFSIQAQELQQETLIGHWTFEPGEELKDLTGNFPDIKLIGTKIDKWKSR